MTSARRPLVGLARNRPLARVAAAYALFVLSEFAVWMALLVHAFDDGGAATAAAVVLAQLAPAALVAPRAARRADRGSPAALLVGGYVVQGAAMAVTGLGVATDRSALAYAAAVVGSTALTTTRPAQAVLVPGLATTADELTAANVVLSWVEAAGIMASGLVVGLLVPVVGLGGVFGVCAVLMGGAVALVAGLRARPAPGAAAAVRPPRRPTSVLRDPGMRVLLGLLTGKAVVVGSLDLLLVVLAVDVLHRSPEWTGYLGSAYGAGAVAVGGLSALLVGRRLGAPLLGCAAVMSGGLLVLAAGQGLASTLVLLALVGGARALLDVAGRTLLQRTAPTDDLGRVFGTLEGLTMAGIAVGALLVPVLVGWGGSRLAVVGVAAVLPLAALVGGRGLLRLDAAARVPVVEISLLRSLPLLAELPPPQLEALARALRRRDLAPGAVLLREGEPGSTYFAVAAGELVASQASVRPAAGGPASGGPASGELRRCGRGEGVGEIALLHDVPRTATVTAATAATVYSLEREDFLAAVLTHAPTGRRAAAITAERLATRPAGSAGA